MARKPRDKNQDDDETTTKGSADDETTTKGSADDGQKPAPADAETAEKPESADAESHTGETDNAQPAEPEDSTYEAETDDQDETSETEETDEKPGKTDAQPGAAKLFTQDDVNRIVAERLKRASAKAADPSDLQSQAAKIGELQAQLEALTAELEARRQADQVAEWKSGVAAQYGVPAELLRGDSLEALTAHAMQLAEYLKPKTDPISLGNEPASVNIPDDPRAEFARQIYRLATQ